MVYVLDTNIFNRLLDGKLQLDELPFDGNFRASYVQYDERAKPRISRAEKCYWQNLAKLSHTCSLQKLSLQTYRAPIWIE